MKHGMRSWATMLRHAARGHAASCSGVGGRFSHVLEFRDRGSSVLLSSVPNWPFQNRSRSATAFGSHPRMCRISNLAQLPTVTGAGRSRAVIQAAAALALKLLLALNSGRLLS